LLHDFFQVKAVVTHFKELINRIQFDHEKQQHSRIYEPLSISIFDPKVVHEKLTTDLQGNLVHSQLLINSLLRMRARGNDKDELIAISKQIYKKNKAELNTIYEFEQNYKPKEAIRWYTRDTFLYRILHKALRTQNIDILFLFQFFIVDIRKQLESIRSKSPIKAFRSQLMPNDEVKKLKSSTGQFISINSFLSATILEDQARARFENSDGLERVLFTIDADPQLSSSKPFANIKSYNFNKEEEVLFMLGSVFEIVDVYRQEGIWIVKLKLCSDNSEQLDLIKDENKFLSFGHVLMTMGKVEEAEIYYRRLIEELEQTQHADLARCYEALGGVADEKGEYSASLELYGKALKINMEKLDERHPDIASNYNSIGEVYRKTGDYKKAFAYYNKALDTLGENPPINGLAKLAVCYNNIGIVYQEQEEYKEALAYYMRALEIRKKHFAFDETSLGMSYNNMGNAYYFLNCYEDALSRSSENLQENSSSTTYEICINL
jgi:tetratricopeptide (TPR) repeat protein